MGTKESILMVADTTLNISEKIGELVRKYSDNNGVTKSDALVEVCLTSIGASIATLYKAIGAPDRVTADAITQAIDVVKKTAPKPIKPEWN